MATKRRYRRKKCKSGRVRSRRTKRCRTPKRKRKCKKGYSKNRRTKKCRKRKCKRGRTRDRVTKKCRKKRKSGKKKRSAKAKARSARARANFKRLGTKVIAGNMAKKALQRSRGKTAAIDAALYGKARLARGG